MVIAVGNSSGGKISKFFFFRINDSRVMEREEINAVQTSLNDFCRQLISLEIDLLICDSLSKEWEQGIFESGINLIKGISGEADKILSAYLNGDLSF